MREITLLMVESDDDSDTIKGVETLTISKNSSQNDIISVLDQFFLSFTSLI